MIIYTWTIANCDFETATGTITRVHWTLKAAEGDLTASTYGVVALSPDLADPAFIPFENATEADLIAWVFEKLDRAATEARLAAQIEGKRAPATASGLPWQASATNMKAKGKTVQHNGKTWESLIDRNVWEPPVGYREVVAEGYPEWVQPTGSADAYSIGDKVTFEGVDYESTIDANTWSPTGYPAGWETI